ncbi:short-chain dehydrogenase/reductase [Penicillium hordei]|uniref:Short-chain dehydrogenase/reductase n=1 Tax=Penicillium hordei TaxID=40994 RepID=A0AAD6E0T1_9EURO|nr:short-chain dehydrogenase/reductase [Penicillium hordei]KAJ5598452.1 short-chain dehydrogenase/reductase [Penicillium hordei]
MPFNPKTDVPNLNGKVILVTGGNSGLGKAAVTEFCRHQPAEVWLAARSLDKAQAAADEIKTQIPNAPIKVLKLDLSSFDSVKNAAKAFTSDQLDILMLNAGVMAVPPAQTSEGYEVQFGTNHMGHAILTKILLPVLERTAQNGSDVRIVSVSSHGHFYTPPEGFQFDTLKTPGDILTAFQRYGQSKLANILWARQLASLYPSFTVASVHPGVVKTNLLSGATNAPLIFRAIFGAAHVLGMKSSVESGVKNQLWAAVSKDVKSGEYYEPIGVSGMASAHGTDDKLAKEIWNWTENELKNFL